MIGLPSLGLRARRMLRAAGFSLCAASCGFLALSSIPAIYASAALGPAASPAPAQDETLNATAPPRLPGAAPKAPKRAARGGPLTLALRGNLIVGERLAASSRVPGSSLTSANAGGSAEITRRTPRTSLVMALPLGVTLGSGSVGDFQIAYNTPHSTLSYQGQSLSAVGQLPMGIAERSLGYTIPWRGGDFTLFGGTASADGLRGFRVYGVRARALVHRGLASAGMFDAIAHDGAFMRGIDVGFASAPGRLDAIAEGVFEQTRGLRFSPEGTSLSYQVRLDYGSPTTYGSATVRKLASGFAALQGAGSHGDRSANLALRTQARKTRFAADAGLESLGTGTDAVFSRRGSLTIDREIGSAGQLTLFLTDNAQTQSDLSIESRSAAANLEFVLRKATLQANFARQTARSPDHPATMQTTAGLSGTRKIGTLDASGGYQISRQSGNGALNASSVVTAGVSRETGRTLLGLVTTYTRAHTPVSDATIFRPLLNVSRQISPVVALTLLAGYTTTSDRLNPLAGGRSSIVNLTVGTPFSLGSGTLTGRADPRLPATIAGTVVNDAVNSGLFNAGISNGVGGIVVVLDGAESQITDAQGGFAFRFVTAGRHEVKLEPGSLPRGYVADNPFVALSIAGGQSAQLSLGVGAFGAVEGRISGRDRDGRLFPIPDANVRLDGLRTVASSAFGGYGFGRLAPGKHTLDLTAATLPATVGLLGDRERTFEVQAGRLVTIDFVAQPLGSIAGRVVEKGAEMNALGLQNAYVVANPGEHAAITGEDGAFIIDNLPAGTYTLSVDLDTLPADSSVAGGPASPVTLEASQQIGGILFAIGHEEKAIDFTFSKKESNAALLRVDIPVMPPGGTSAVTATLAKAAPSGKLTAFGHTTELRPDAARKVWTGRLLVPADTKGGHYEVTFASSGANAAQAAIAVDVDPAIPIATFGLTPARPLIGQYTRVRAHFVTDVSAGDRIVWEDGTVTTLGGERGPRLFEFTIKVGARPYRGVLVTRNQSLPVSL